jgi:hypothetical protein
MKLRIKKKKEEKINEEDVATTITDPSLLGQAQQLQNDKQKLQDEFNKAQTVFNKAQEKFNKEVKIIDDKYAQLLKKQEILSKSNPQQPQQESFNYKNGKRLFEGAGKKDLLVDALTVILTGNEEDFSYDLSQEEIRRVARKINDYLREHKNQDITWEDVRYVIKNYFIKHNVISFSQTEINLLNDLLEDYLKDNEIKEFSEYFE